jgi:hypothetical protein
VKNRPSVGTLARKAAAYAAETSLVSSIISRPQRKPYDTDGRLQKKNLLAAIISRYHRNGIWKHCSNAEYPCDRLNPESEQRSLDALQWD